MKTISVLILVIISLNQSIVNQDLETIKAVFDGYEDGTYYFTDSEDEEKYYSFEKIDESILKTFNLKSEEYRGKSFKVTYKIETVKDEFGEDYEVWVIAKLALL